MQLLMTTDAIGGVWNYSLELCGAFGAHGIRVALAVLGGPPSNAQREQAGRLSNVTVHESSFRLEWMTDPWEDLARAGEWLLSLEKMTGADVVHLNHLVHADLPWQAPVMTVKTLERKTACGPERRNCYRWNSNSGGKRAIQSHREGVSSVS